jgi:hypothetical protein
MPLFSRELSMTYLSPLYLVEHSKASLPLPAKDGRGGLKRMGRVGLAGKGGRLRCAHPLYGFRAFDLLGLRVFWRRFFAKKRPLA